MLYTGVNDMIYKNYVGGVWVEGATKKTFQNINPATGDVLSEFQDCKNPSAGC